MACFLVGHLTITNMDGYKEYAALVPALIAAHGGTYLVRGGHATDIEGQMPGDRHVVIRWPDRATLEKFYDSPEYQAILPFRQDNSTGVLTFVDGVEP